MKDSNELRAPFDEKALVVSMELTLFAVSFSIVEMPQSELVTPSALSKRPGIFITQSLCRPMIDALAVCTESRIPFDENVYGANI